MPGFFGDQADRLLRKNWTDPMELAQELWAMFTADVPMTTDQPVIITRNNNNTPATQIIDNTNGSSSPIVINRPPGSAPSPQPNADSGGGYSCCGSSKQNGQPKPPKDPSKNPFPGGGDVGPAPAPGGGGTEPPKDPNTPYCQYVANVEIEINQGPPDIFGWDGEKPSFAAVGCFPCENESGTIKAPDDAFDDRFDDPNGTIQEQIDSFMARFGLDGYDIISESVNGPGGRC